jgi:uncharacterized protein
MHYLTAHPGYSISGLVVGLLVDFTGISGSALMTPLLVTLFGIRATTAVGTDLLYACATKSVGTAVHGFCGSGTIEWSIVRRIPAGSVPFTALALLSIAHYQSHLESSSKVITTVLGVALILTAASVVFRKRILDALADFAAKLTQRDTTLLTVALGATGSSDRSTCLSWLRCSWVPYPA